MPWLEVLWVTGRRWILVWSPEPYRRMLRCPEVPAAWMIRDWCGGELCFACLFVFLFCFTSSEYCRIKFCLSCGYNKNKLCCRHCWKPSLGWLLQTSWINPSILSTEVLSIVRDLLWSFSIIPLYLGFMILQLSCAVTYTSINCYTRECLGWWCHE